MKVHVWIDVEEAKRLFRLGKIWFDSVEERNKFLAEAFPR